MDIPEEHILLVDNGEKITFENGQRIPGYEPVEVDGIMIDGHGPYTAEIIPSALNMIV